MRFAVWRKHLNEMKFLCPRCGIGYCHPHSGIFADMVGNRLIRADVTIYTCDICSYSEYDILAMARLRQLLGIENEEALCPSSTIAGNIPDADTTRRPKL